MTLYVVFVQYQEDTYLVTKVKEGNYYKTYDRAYEVFEQSLMTLNPSRENETHHKDDNVTSCYFQIRGKKVDVMIFKLEPE